MPISKNRSPQDEMGLIVEGICNGSMTEGDWAKIQERLRDSIDKGANPNIPMKINGENVLPVEVLVVAATEGRAMSSGALAVLIEDQSKIPGFFLNLSGARSSLGGLAPLEYIAKHTPATNSSYDARMAATLIAGEVQAMEDISAIQASAGNHIATAIAAARQRPKSARQRRNERTAGLC